MILTAWLDCNLLLLLTRWQTNLMLLVLEVGFFLLAVFEKIGILRPFSFAGRDISFLSLCEQLIPTVIDGINFVVSTSFSRLK